MREIHNDSFHGDTNEEWKTLRQVNKKGEVMKDRNARLLGFLFGCCLFLAVGIGCLKAVTAHVVRDAYIGSAFSFRTNDAVALACPDLKIDRAIEIAQLVEKHPQLDHVIHRYLSAYASFLAGRDSSLEKMDNSRFFRRLNRDILKAVKKNADGSLVMSDEDFLLQLTEAEDEAEWILRNQIPSMLRNFGEPATTAIRAYGAATSFWMQTMLFLGMLLPLLGPVVLCAKEASKGIASARGYYRCLGKISLLEGCFLAVVPPVCIKAADRWLLSVTDRLMGRSMYLDPSPFLWRGMVLMGIGGIVWFLASKFPALKLSFRNVSHGAGSTMDQ